ncbi:MAG: hypothetical protein GF320_14975 [Armatimonadia bacterium]|nr:hypothetical protein [Armatimonadia bacterium]
MDAATQLREIAEQLKQLGAYLQVKGAIPWQELLVAAGDGVKGEPGAAARCREASVAAEQLAEKVDAMPSDGQLLRHLAGVLRSISEVEAAPPPEDPSDNGAIE